MSEESINVDGFPYPFIEGLFEQGASNRDVLHLLSINKANQKEREWLIQQILLYIHPNNKIEYNENNPPLQMYDILPKIKFVLDRMDCSYLIIGRIKKSPYNDYNVIKKYREYEFKVGVGTRIDGIPSKLEIIQFNIMDTVKDCLNISCVMTDILIELVLFFKREEIFIFPDGVF